jgi:flagellar basal body rod protein FlgC
MLWTVMDANANGVVDMSEFVNFVEEMTDTASGDTARASSASSSISSYAKDLRQV